LVFRTSGEQLSENDQHFFLGSAYLDAPLEELKTGPDYARQGVQEMERYLHGATSPEISALYRSRSEALLGKGYRALNQSDQALTHYQKSVSLDQAQLEPIYQLALLYAERGDAAASEAYFSRILRLFPDHVPSFHGLGALAEAAGRPEAAVQYFEDAIHLFPGALSSHYQLAQIYLRQQRTDTALLELQSCLALNPRYLPALMDLGHLFAGQNRLAESQQLFERALQLDSSREEIFGAISVVATLQGHPDEAIKVLHQAVTKGIAGEMTWMNLGNLYAQREDFQQAIRFFSKARVEDPRNTKALLGLGICYVRTGELAKGKSSLEQVLRLEPQNGEARQFLDQINSRPDLRAR
jgi:tetratricopeptide (TPR) repeat protein